MVVCLTVEPASGRAQPINPDTIPTRSRLSGLSADEAATLIATLEAAQDRLKGRKFQPFELLAGSIASYDMTRVSPRDAFLGVAFKKVWRIERVPTDNRLWQPYRMSYAPDGLGQPYWDIEVVLGVNGDLERVTMTYKPPAPF